MSGPFVAVMMGSDSDLPVLEPAIEILRKLEITVEVKVCSAHRTPIQTQQYVTEADTRGCAVFIAAAGMAAHLAGAVAAHTLKPVIGVPVEVSLGGLDSLLSTVQMPAGIPVATVAVGSAGAKNAAYLAAQILSLSDSELALALRRQRDDNATAIMAKDQALQLRLASRLTGNASKPSS